MTTRVVTYNLLSTKLAGPDYHVHCEAKYLATEYRWEKLQAKLLTEMKNNAIICLQEVSTEWLEKLTPFFNAQQYTIVGGTYGYAPYDGDMGVFVAYPHQSVKLEELRLSKPGREIKKYTVKLLKSRYERFINYIFWMIIVLFKFPVVRSMPFKDKLMKLIMKKEDPWQKAIAKDNILLLCRFKSKPEAPSFCVATYHMPCNFTNPSLMLIHSSIAVKMVASFAGKDRYVFAGDFNLKPVDLGYKMITEGGSNYNQAVERSPDLKVQWVASVEQPLMSAYKELNGKEPKFTNFSFCKGAPQFKDCIDYIFCSKGWKVTGVTPLPEETVGEAYPGADEPSDHLMIGANLTMVD